MRTALVVASCLFCASNSLATDIPKELQAELERYSKAVFSSSKDKIQYVAIDTGTFTVLAADDEFFRKHSGPTEAETPDELIRRIAEHRAKPGELFIRNLELSNPRRRRAVVKVRGRDTWGKSTDQDYYLALNLSTGTGIGTRVWTLDMLNGFDGEDSFTGWPVNPPLTENPAVYYRTLGSASSSPLKVLASRFYVDKNDVVNVHLVVQNTAAKTVVGIRGDLAMYDKMDFPVTWGGGKNIFGFMSQDEAIKPNATKTIGPWALRLYNKTRKVAPKVHTVQFEDGTLWKLDGRKKN